MAFCTFVELGPILRHFWHPDNIQMVTQDIDHCGRKPIVTYNVLIEGNRNLAPLIKFCEHPGSGTQSLGPLY